MAKTPNYTPDMVEMIRETYLPVRGENQETRDATVLEIVETLRKEPFNVIREKKSVISKMCRMLTPEGEQLYVRKVPVSKATGEPAIKKSAMAETLATAINAANPAMDENERKVPRVSAANLEKLNKSDLQAIQFYVTANTEMEETEEATEEATEA